MGLYFQAIHVYIFQKKTIERKHHIMIQQTVTYKDIDGNEQHETLLFHFYKEEILEMLRSGYFDQFFDAMKADDIKKKSEVLEALVDKAYGFRYVDENIDPNTGMKTTKTRFRHATEEELKQFHEDEARGEFVFMLHTDAGKADDFISALIPSVQKTAII